jgi:hypothetical protein
MIYLELFNVVNSRWRTNLSDMFHPGARIAQLILVTKLRAGLSGQGFFSLRHRVQTDSGAHSASCPVGTGGSFPRIKRAGREADHFNLVLKLRMYGAIPQFPHSYLVHK